MWAASETAPRTARDQEDEEYGEETVDQQLESCLYSLGAVVGQTANLHS